MTDTNYQQQLAVKELAPIAADANALITTIEGFEIIDEASCAQLVDLRKTVMLAEKKLAAKKRLVRKPLADALKALDAMFKPASDQIARALSLTKAKLDQWARQQYVIEQERKRIEREAAAEQERIAKKQAEEMRRLGAEETAQVIEKQAEKATNAAAKPAAPEIIRGQASSLVTVRTWKAHVFSKKDLCKAIGAGQMPLEAVEIRQSVLDSLARDFAAERELHGVTFFEQISTQTK
jgi:hypothetical protein